METQHNDVFAIITNRIIDQLEKQFIPWRKPWAEGGHPQNLLTKRPYNGINTWLLGSLGYAQNYFLTWDQLKAAGGSVKKGEKGTLVVFWKILQLDPAKDNREPQHVKSALRYYYVFNISQIKDLPDTLTIPYPPDTICQIGACDEIVERMPKCPAIKYGKQKVYYDPLKDYINMPRQGSFITPESYYCSLFHELIHSTGHQSRLNRKEIVEPTNVGSDLYSIEELTAEIGACYLNSVSGIINKEFDNSMAYIQGWINALKDDKQMIVYASEQALRATDYILRMKSYVQNDAVQPVEEIETQ